LNTGWISDWEIGPYGTEGRLCIAGRVGAQPELTPDDNLPVWLDLKWVYMLERNGRHEETRTPDLYRVNLVVITNTKTYKALAALKIPVSRARSGIMCPFCALALGFCALE
jgi:hypothetical protein